MPRAAERAVRAQPRVDSRTVKRLVERSLHEGSRAMYRDALLYDHFYRRRNHDTGFYVQMAQRYGGPVLELGVGTGRVAAALAKAEISVTGVDLMPTMLAQARARIARLPEEARRRVTFVRADLRGLALAKRYPLVFAPFNVFSHLYSRTDVERALATCRRHLGPRGRLVFDVGMPDLGALMQDPSRLYRCRDVVDPSTGERFTYSEASHYDVERQVRSMTLQLTSKTHAARGRTISLTHRQFFPEELRALLHYNGFMVAQQYGDFSMGPLTAWSETQVIVARLSNR